MKSDLGSVAGISRIVVKSSAAKDLASLGNKLDRRRIVQAIAALTQNSGPPGCKRLSAQTDLYRVSSENFRAIYEMVGDMLFVAVVNFGHRK